jgi:hypothetical protein
LTRPIRSCRVHNDCSHQAACRVGGPLDQHAPRVVASLATTRTGLAPPPRLGARPRRRVCRALPRTLESDAVNRTPVRKTRPFAVLFVCGCRLRCTLVFRRATSRAERSHEPSTADQRRPGSDPTIWVPGSANAQQDFGVSSDTLKRGGSLGDKNQSTVFVSSRVFTRGGLRSHTAYLSLQSGRKTPMRAPFASRRNVTG